MKLIPQRLKDLFTRKSKKDAVATPASVETAVATPEPVVEAPKQPTLQEKRLQRLTTYKSEEGVYTFNIDITQPNGVMGDKTMLMVSNRDTDLFVAMIGHSPLAGTRDLANAIEEHMIKHLGLDVGKTYFKMKNENFYIDGYDAFTGLPAGSSYQMVLVPEGNNWRPPVMVPAARKAVPDTCPLLSKPTLPPWLQQKLSNGNKPKPPVAPK